MSKKDIDKIEIQRGEKYQKFYEGKLIIYNYSQIFFFYKKQCYQINKIDNYCFINDDEKYIKDQINSNLINTSYFNEMFRNYEFSLEELIKKYLTKKIITYNNYAFYYYNNDHICFNGFFPTKITNYLHFLVDNFVYDNVYEEIENYII